MQKAIVIIPTYNERENIAKMIPTLQEVFKKIKKWQLEILVVDDSSPDKTYEQVKSLQKQYKNLNLLINKKKAGLGTAYLKGMAKAFGELEADVVFEFDADFSHDPEKIPEFLTKIDEGYDLVLGSRYIKGGSIPKNWGLDRKFLSVVGNLIIVIVFTNFKIRDWTGGFRAIKKEVYEAVHKDLNSERFSGYTFQIGFLHKAVKKGFKITEIPFHFIDRTIGVSKLPSDYIKNNLIYIFKVRIQEIIENRVFKFLVVGGLGATIQFITAVVYANYISYALSLGVLILSLPDFLAIETAVISNFVLNNLWTFADRKLHSSEYLSKFLKFNLASMGSVIIQTIIIGLGLGMIGLFDLFTIPVVGLTISTRILYHAVGIIIGLFWNFFAYNKFIWRKK